VRGFHKSAAAAALLLAVAAGGCGGSGSSSSSGSTAQASSGQDRQPQAQPNQAQQQQQSQANSGAAEFRVQGGDNSIQDFGGEASSSELEEAATALHGFLDARVAGEWSKACTYLTEASIKSFEQITARPKQGQGGCGATMAALSAGLPKSGLEEAAQADVGALRTEGDRGFLLYHGARNADYAISMTKEGGSWKVGALAGVPLS
jgi:hypothetical protein